MAPDDPSGARPAAPVVLRIKLRYDSVEVMIQRFAPNVGKTGLFLPTKSLQPIGSEIKFELRLVNDRPILVGQGRVKAVREPDPTNLKATFGMAVELLRVTRESRDLILKILERRKQLGMPDIGIPMPADIDAARRADFIDTGVTAIPSYIPSSDSAPSSTSASTSTPPSTSSTSTSTSTSTPSSSPSSTSASASESTSTPSPPSSSPSSSKRATTPPSSPPTSTSASTSSTSSSSTSSPSTSSSSTSSSSQLAPSSSSSSSSSSGPVLTAPRRTTGPIAIAKDNVAPRVAPLAPEPPRRKRVPVADLIASASGPVVVATSLEPLDDSNVDLAAALARARSLITAGADLDSELVALRDAAAAPLEPIDIEAASAELARQLGGAAVRRDRSGAHRAPSTNGKSGSTDASGNGARDMHARDVDARDGIDAGDERDDVPADRRADVPAESRADVPADSRADVPSDRRADVPADRRADVPSDRSDDMPSEGRADMPSDRGADMRSDRSADMPSEGRADMPPSALSPADMSPADMSPADMSPADMSPADMSPADMSPADMSPADMSPADMSPDRPADVSAHGGDVSDASARIAASDRAATFDAASGTAGAGAGDMARSDAHDTYGDEIYGDAPELDRDDDRGRGGRGGELGDADATPIVAESDIPPTLDDDNAESPQLFDRSSRRSFSPAHVAIKTEPSAGALIHDDADPSEFGGAAPVAIREAGGDEHEVDPEQIHDEIHRLDEGDYEEVEHTQIGQMMAIDPAAFDGHGYATLPSEQAAIADRLDAALAAAEEEAAADDMGLSSDGTFGGTHGIGDSGEDFVIPLGGGGDGREHMEHGDSDREGEGYSQNDSLIAALDAAAHEVAHEDDDIEEIDDFEILAEADIDDDDQVQTLRADGGAVMRGGQEIDSDRATERPPSRPSFLSRLELEEEESALEAARAAGAAGEAGEGRVSRNAREHSFSELSAEPGEIDPRVLSAGYALQAFEEPDDGGDFNAPGTFTPIPAEPPVYLGRPPSIGEQSYTDVRDDELDEAHGDYAMRGFVPPNAFDQSDVIAIESSASGPQGVNADDYDLETALEALDVDLDDLGARRATPVPVVTGKSGRIHKRATTEDGIVIDFDDDGDDDDGMR